jgi:hypothetical protein
MGNHGGSDVGLVGGREGGGGVRGCERRRKGLMDGEEKVSRVLALLEKYEKI